MAYPAVALLSPVLDEHTVDNERYAGVVPEIHSENVYS
jgi:hypothetical protein